MAGLAISLIGVAATLCTPSASAVTHVSIGPTDPVTGVGDAIVDGDAARNDIRVGWDPDRHALVVSDAHPIEASGCMHLSRRSVRCHVKRQWLSVTPGPGRDRVSLRPGVPDWMNARVFGGPRRDVLIGGREDDELTGGPGNDVLLGGLGDDRLIGESGVSAHGYPPSNDTLRGGQGDDHLGNQFERGSDRFFGGQGNDTINAEDGGRDRRVDGGSGRDSCTVDQRDDPSPTGCERMAVPGR